MKFQTKLFFSFGILILMLFVLAGLSINLIGNIKDEVNTTASVYFPIQDEAFTLRGYIFNISGAVNFYTNTNSKEEWNKVETLLAKLSTVMNNLTHSIEKTGRPEKSVQLRQINAVLTDYEKNLRDTHAHNEMFIAIRDKMLAEANTIAATTITMVTYYTKKLEQTARNGDLQKMQQIRLLSDLAIQMNTSIGFIRINMLRSLAEQNFIYVEKSFKEHFPAMLKTLNEIPSYMDLPEEKEQTLLFRQKVESFKNTQQAIVHQWKQKSALEKERNALQVKAIAQSGSIAEDSTAMQSQSMDKVTTVVERAISLSLIISGIALVIGITVAFFLIHNVLRQLGKDPGELGNIAQRVIQGDYDVDDGSPKIGVFGNLVMMVAALKQNIDKARHESERAAEESSKTRSAMDQAEKARMEAQSKTESMLDIADKLEQMADIVSSASTDLSIQIGQSEHGATEQAARVAETAIAIEEMNSTVLEVAQNAGSASDISAQTRQKADNGAKIVKKAVNAIQHVQQQSLALKEDMAALSGHAQAISQIMSVISDIADQTNLLALNAAIEAARAGEAGRGFAVVADEVRKLAEKTMASTTDVGNAIRSIQESANNNTRQVDKAVQMIEEATAYANQSGDALTEIVGMVDQTADQVRAIATAAEQQSTSSEKINQSIAQVRSIADETAQAMAEATKAMSDLVHQAQVLTTLIEDLKQH